MKKWLLCLIVSLVFVSTVNAADFNFGTDTYEQVDDILIVNSLGDKVQESTFDKQESHLGFNDFIPENAFKNNLHQDGYTKVYDSKPTGVDVVEVGYMGLRGDPRTYDSDYVLKSEYDKYSAQSQDTRIDENKTDIIDVENSVTNNVANIKHNVNSIASNRSNIANTVTYMQNNTNRINQNASAIQENSNRIGELEEMKVGVHAEVELYDTKYVKFGAYATYDTRHGRWDALMAKVTLKLGKSYELKRLEKLEREIAIREAIQEARIKLYNDSRE